MSTPLDDYWAEKDKLAAERGNEDTQHWQAWKAQPTPENLSSLLGRFDDDFGKTVRRFRARNVNEAAMRANLARHAINAFENYDPTRGASLRTHVNNMMQRVDRFNRNNQNLAFIPEEKSRLIGPIDTATGQLTEALGRAPTHQEIASHLALSGRSTVTAKHVQEIQELRRADIMGSTFLNDPSGFQADPHEQVLRLLPETLAGDEVHVFDYLYGRNGKPKVESTGEIAKRLGKSPSQVSRIKGKIEDKYRKAVR